MKGAKMAPRFRTRCQLGGGTGRMFPVDARVSRDGQGNQLVIDFDDPGWIAARFLAKEPGATMRLGASSPMSP